MSDTTSGTSVDERREQLRAELTGHTMYELLGGEVGVRRIVDRFYDTMDADAAFAPIRSMHTPDLAPMRQGLLEFLSGWLGGPPLYATRTGSVCLSHAHAPFPIDDEARDLWLRCMERAMGDADIAERYREVLMPAFGNIADMMRNT